MAFESSSGFFELVRKTLKQIVLLTDNRRVNPADLSVAFSKQACSIGFSHTNERKRFNADSKKCCPVSQ